ncbi:4'-phosphopantetheinyl transferase family protein [Shimwellia blattae]|uniref:Enterobactin synthase component D n=1 Tax=Shimwellia blattae (strain ATCC 29907 / DSM 4481 / JCM 1650 / NBRC 105725 / CDC 9005-74) TaxID=630626 RepID=I2B7U4_SHIBC|nr:4'-phosphopantetheinyl transferase superfamily protein [Shimwellia blattae]AFJ46598.1 putative 4'-phosphopantetheinyl transferase [Shimwellia blattae DSM 4481 = NBRC 105725]GAB80178.1 putative 4'-phosphopantetheinyl transferase [Shimwellia blattae DSM 4481 = NBRC 105725]VDY64070.1 phosphopantetheinyltransferase component of enterobactin synthase multienzyme complex [Shimwellia blattae]VEC22202.1 phosphopantetheinyltransferase component of enterobactin synthase multienzyme complex [Shimwellia
MPAFIRNVTLSPHPHQPGALCCEVHFNPAAWQDTLFSQLGILRPAHLARAVPKRLAEYLAGRYACQQILRHWGITADITSGSNREPLWPPAVAGSLSHSAERALALLIPARYGLSPGVDIEMADARTLLSIASAIATPEEQAQFSTCGLTDYHGLLLTFSAKESLFKALYPQVGRYFGCDAAALYALDMAQQQFVLQLRETLAPAAVRGTLYRGNFSLTNGGVMTSLFCAG